MEMLPTMFDSLMFPFSFDLETLMFQEIATVFLLFDFVRFIILHILVNVSFKQPLRSRPIDLNEGITTPSFPEIQLVVLSVI